MSKPVEPCQAMYCTCGWNGMYKQLRANRTCPLCGQLADMVTLNGYPVIWLETRVDFSELDKMAKQC